MPLDWQIIKTSDFSGGEDSRSAPSNILEGFLERALNAETSPAGYVGTRPGYELYYGYVPLRVTEIRHSGTQIELKFGSSEDIDLTSVSASPLLVYGKLPSSQSGDFSTTSALRYYPTFTVGDKVTYTTGDTTETLSASDHGLSSYLMFVGSAKSTSSSDRSNVQVIPDGVTINRSTYAVTLDVIPTASEDHYPFFLERTTSSGNVYVTSVTSQTSVAVSAATHGLNNYNIIVKCFETSAGNNIEVIPDAVTISSAGTVTVTFTSAFTGDIILSSVPNTNYRNTAASAGANQITISNATSPFAFFAIYAYNSSSGNLEQVIPDGISYDDSTQEFTIDYYLASGSENVEVYYQYGTPVSNRIFLTDTGAVSTSYTVTNPQLTVWGISHEGIYTSSTGAGGHVTHLDTYARSGESRAVCGLGGVLHSARTRAEDGTTYGMPSYAVNLRSRVSTSAKLAPLFHDASSTDERTRGTIVDTSVSSDHYARCTAVTYVSAGVVDYTLSFANKTGTVAIGSTLSTRDKLTVTGVPYSAYNGTFSISSIQSDSATQTVIRVSNSAAYTADFDDSGLEARAGVFTDEFTVTATPPFAAGDVLRSSAVSSSLTLTVNTTASTTVSLAGVTDEVSLPAGLLLFAQRTSTVIPLRNSSATATVENIVKGDMLVVTGIDRRVKVKSIDTTNKTITIDESLTVLDGLDDPTEMYVEGRWIPIEIPTTTYDLPSTAVVRHFDQNDALSQPTLRSTIIADSMLFTNQQDEVMKFDGTNIYRAGLVRWQPQLFINVDDSQSSIANTNPSLTVSNPSSNAPKFTLTAGESSLISVGDRISNSVDSTIYTVVGKASNSSNDFLYLDQNITSHGSYSSSTIKKVARRWYYVRLRAVDANNNIVASAATGANDLVAEIASSAQVKLRLVGMPAFGYYDYDRIELDLFCTKLNQPGVFYRNKTVAVSFDADAGYIDITDADSDDVLTDPDDVSTALLGAEIGPAWDQPLRAKYMTSTDNRLILANLKDYPQLDITLRRASGTASLTAANIDQFRWLFRKDSTDTGTTTDMVNRVAYEFVDGGEVTIDPSTDISVTAGTSFVVTSTAHGLEVGDWVYFFHPSVASNNSLTFAGWFQISAKDTNTFTCLHSGAVAASSADVTRYVTATAQEDVPVWVGTDYNYGYYNGNPSTSIEYRAMLRLGNAINASMRMVNTADADYTNFVPWLTAGSGGDFAVGQLVVRNPNADSDTMEVLLDTIGSTFEVFVNNILRDSDEQVSAQSRLYPSRVIVSYPNFSEIFDAPQGDPGRSDSAVDVNAEDGQEITGVIPFFGASVFSDSRGEAMVAVFKTNSVHVLDPASKAVQRVEQPYGGCTAPYSICQTRKGIVFANESGVYRLNNDLTVDRIGRNLERWKTDVNRSYISVASGHNYITGNKYKLSAPVGASQTTNNYVYVYDFTKEEEGNGIGSWTRSDNHNAIAWANLGKDSLWASTEGEVFKIRNYGDVTDYRDDESAISLDIITPAVDFDITTRKSFGGVHLEFHNNLLDLTGITVSTAVDLNNTFQTAGTLNNSSGESAKSTGAWFSVAQRKGNRIQTRIQCSTKDAPVRVAAISYKVAGLSSDRMNEAADYT